MTDISLVIPTMNEEEGITECIDAAKDAFDEMGMDGEIILSDSSTDDTAKIAKKKGAKVVKPDRPGYGYAYRYAFKEASGDIIAMGDGDTTYDFRELPSLIERMRKKDADIAMGSRLDGEIKPGSMPKLHKYIGNPLLTKFLNKFYGAGVKDAHSGMRVIKKNALQKLDLKSNGMEFASEMIMEAGARDLRIVEKPIVYHEREGEATLHSFRDGWRHVRFMLKNAPSYLFFWPGVSLIGAGAAVTALSVTEFTFNSTNLGINSQIAGLLLLLTGLQVSSLSIFTHAASEPVKEKGEITQRITSAFSLEKGLGFGSIATSLGGIYGMLLILNWYQSGFTDVPTATEGLLSFAAITVGLQTAFNSFFLSIASDPYEA